jgi:hypothetical protein
LIWSKTGRPQVTLGALYCQKHIVVAMPLHDIAVLGLIVLFVASVLGVRILWDIFKLIRGFWIDYRRVNRLDE